MTLRPRLQAFAVIALLSAGSIVAGVGAQDVPLAPVAIDSARVSIAGTSNIHSYTASTTAVHVTRAQLANGAGTAEFCARCEFFPGVARATRWAAARA